MKDLKVAGGPHCPHSWRHNDPSLACLGLSRLSFPFAGHNRVLDFTTMLSDRVLCFIAEVRYDMLLTLLTCHWRGCLDKSKSTYYWTDSREVQTQQRCRLPDVDNGYPSQEWHVRRGILC